MKYAIVENKKTEAYKGAKGSCSSCGSELIAKCGEIKANHWSHKGRRHCDPWWENETEWHRSWKNNFPIEWQEIVSFDEEIGEKHIADVRTTAGWVIEFQHSYLKPSERRSRNAFYNNLVWVVDGTRRKTDRAQFLRLLNEDSINVIANPPTIKAHFPDECRIIKEWRSSSSLVFFDFGGGAESMLWLLYPELKSGNVYLSYLNRKSFIELSNDNGFENLVKDVVSPMHKEILPAYENKIKNHRY